MPSITLTATKAEQQQAVQEGYLRYQAAAKGNWQAYGDGSLLNHQSGRLAEIIFARFLGTPVCDWTWAADVKQKCDLTTLRKRDGKTIRWHVRSTRFQHGTMIIKPGDPNTSLDYYVLVDTSKSPTVKIIGWTQKQQVTEKYPLTSMRVNPNARIWEPEREFLHPFPDIFPMG